MRFKLQLITAFIALSTLGSSTASAAECFYQEFLGNVTYNQFNVNNIGCDISGQKCPVDHYVQFSHVTVLGGGKQCHMGVTCCKKWGWHIGMILFPDEYEDVYVNFWGDHIDSSSRVIVPAATIADTVRINALGY